MGSRKNVSSVSSERKYEHSPISIAQDYRTALHARRHRPRDQERSPALATANIGRLSSNAAHDGLHPHWISTFEETRRSRRRRGRTGVAELRRPAGHFETECGRLKQPPELPTRPRHYRGQSHGVRRRPVGPGAVMSEILIRSAIVSFGRHRGLHRCCVKGLERLSNLSRRVESGSAPPPGGPASRLSIDALLRTAATVPTAGGRATLAYGTAGIRIRRPSSMTAGVQCSG